MHNKCGKSKTIMSSDDYNKEDRVKKCTEKSGRVPHMTFLLSSGHITVLALMYNNTQRIFPTKEALQDSEFMAFWGEPL